MFKSRNPPNPFHDVTYEREEPPLPARLEVREDHAKTAIREVDSPDIGFRWSLNPYRGCTHACAYCYARRTHEYLDLGAGSDFERVLMVKHDLAQVLEAELGRRSWKGEVIHMAGVTDLYQPIERKLKITRACLEVLVRYRNPVAIITRSPLVERDLDLLLQLAEHKAVTVSFSIPILDADVCRALEPGTMPPAARLRAMEALASAGIPVGVSLAPVIPGLTDHLIPRTLQAARAAGATWAFMSALRLPGNVETVFVDRLREALPLRAEAVFDRIRRAHHGQMKTSAFGDRMRGHDQVWALTDQVFDTTCKRLGFTSPPPYPEVSPFRVPGRGVQLAMFG
jgi:DNA repair photolyase